MANWCGIGAAYGNRHSGNGVHHDRLRQHRTIASAVFGGSFEPEMRYFFLQYTKYSREKYLFPNSKSLTEYSCRTMRCCPKKCSQSFRRTLCAHRAENTYARMFRREGSLYVTIQREFEHDIYI